MSIFTKLQFCYFTFLIILSFQFRLYVLKVGMLSAFNQSHSLHSQNLIILIRANHI